MHTIYATDFLDLVELVFVAAEVGEVEECLAGHGFDVELVAGICFVASEFSEEVADLPLAGIGNLVGILEEFSKLEEAGLVGILDELVGKEELVDGLLRPFLIEV